MNLYLRLFFLGVPGCPKAIVPFRPYIILSTKWDGTLHGSPPATALYRGPRSKRGGRTATPKIQRAVNLDMAYGAPRTPPPHPLLRHIGALFIRGAPLYGAPRCCSCSDGPGSTVQKANAPPCGLPREKEACAGTLEKWRDKYCEHHWPKDLLTAARWTSPGRRTPQIPQIMGFSWDLHWVFMGFSWGFHGVFMGCLLEA